jgi:hypothetical protein
VIFFLIFLEPKEGKKKKDHKEKKDPLAPDLTAEIVRFTFTLITPLSEFDCFLQAFSIHTKELNSCVLQPKPQGKLEPKPAAPGKVWVGTDDAPQSKEIPIKKMTVKHLRKVFKMRHIKYLVSM